MTCVLTWTVVVIPELIIPSENRTDDSPHVQGKKLFISLCFLTLLSVRSLFHHKRMHFLDFPCVSCIISIMVSSCTNSSLCCGLKTRPQHKVADVLCNVFCFSGKIKNTCQPFQLFNFLNPSLLTKPQMSCGLATIRWTLLQVYRHCKDMGRGRGWFTINKQLLKCMQLFHLWTNTKNKWANIM